MPCLLFIDTTAAHSAIHLLTAANTIKSFYSNEPKLQAALINIAIDDLFREAGVSLSDLDGVVVNAGPGSYTDLRIALSCAKGLCFALDIPLIATNKLQLIALTYLHQVTNNILVVLQARTDEYFVAAYTSSFRELQSPKHMFRADVENLVKDSDWDTIIVVGDETIFESSALHLNNELEINSTKWTELGLSMYESQQFENIAYFEPLYLKAVYTTVPRNKSLK